MLALLLAAAPAWGVVVRGRVTTGLGAPVPGARVQLISLAEGPRSVGAGVSVVDGEFEIRTSLGGRFVLLTSSRNAVQIGEAFYGGSGDVLRIVIALDADAITPQLSEAATGLATPVEELAGVPARVAADELPGEVTLVRALRGVVESQVVERGEVGAVARLYVRGGAPSGVLGLVDGASMAEVASYEAAGGVDWGRVSMVGLAGLASRPAVEVLRGAQPASGVGAQAGVIALHSVRAQGQRPTLVYTVDGGSLGSLRNAGEVSAARSRGDGVAAFSRFDTTNEGEPFHLAGAALNAGYQVSGATSLRVMLRRDVGAGAVETPRDFLSVVPVTRLGTQNMFGEAKFETKTSGEWRNSIAFGLARQRAQRLVYAVPSGLVPVTIVGANGSSASGSTSFAAVPGREDFVTARDRIAVQTDAPLRTWLSALLRVSYEDARGAEILPGAKVTLERHHVAGVAVLQGAVKHRVFYEAAGLVDRSPSLGVLGGPRVGLTYAAVLPDGGRKLHGTVFHAAAGTGFREPRLEDADAVVGRSRTFEVGLEQTITSRVKVTATYFHNQFSHEAEVVSLAPLVLAGTTAYRAQGATLEARWQPTPRLGVSAGYTYLAAVVEQSGQVPVATAAGLVGRYAALVGARPFERAPQTMFARAEYSGNKLTAGLRASVVGRSDGTSASLFFVPAANLLLPNKDFSPGYAAVDAHAGYALTRWLTVFTELTNLLDDRHMAPVGFRSTPFVARTGVRLRVGGD